MSAFYYQLFTIEKGKEKIRRIKVSKKTIENIFHAYKNCPDDEIIMSFGCGPEGIYDFFKMVKVTFKKGDYNSLKMATYDKIINMVNDEKDNIWLTNRCAKIWKLPLPFKNILQ